ncbi:glycosyltransferase family 4 protein [Aquirufa sp. ROCK2-A2]
MSKICCIFNFAPHYRSSIYELMGKELDCDFYFGDKSSTPIKKLNYGELKGFKQEIENCYLGNTFFIWQKNVLKLVFKPSYKTFLLTGDSSILSNWLIAIFARLLNKKVIIWTHGMQQPLTFTGKLINYPLYYLSNKILLYGNYGKKLMISEGFKVEKLEVIYNSLHHELQLKVRSKLNESDVYSSHFGNNFPVIIYVGRLQRVKKIDLILEAMNLLHTRNVFCNLVLLGEKMEDFRLDFSAGVNLEACLWEYGPCYDENILGDLIYNSDVCVSPGNIGLTSVHSLSYGTPCITHNNFKFQMPEFEVIEEGETGDFFIENDAIDLALKMEKWLGLEKGRREAVRDRAYAKIDQYYNPNYQLSVLKKVL